YRFSRLVCHSTVILRILIPNREIKDDTRTRAAVERRDFHNQSTWMMVAISMVVNAESAVDGEAGSLKS
ncbi:hypothetical protein CDAR_200581, partial [Caerostris darwini]